MAFKGQTAKTAGGLGVSGGQEQCYLSAETRARVWSDAERENVARNQIIKRIVEEHYRDLHRHELISLTEILWRILNTMTNGTVEERKTLQEQWWPIRNKVAEVLGKGA